MPISLQIADHEIPRRTFFSLSQRHSFPFDNAAEYLRIKRDSRQTAAPR
jgi:hypothetical protein